MSELERSAAALREVIETASRGLVRRETVVQVIVLAAVAREHVLLVGPPGTAKSEAVRRVAKGLGGSYFEYLLGRFTEPSELFGPVDLRKLREAVVETRTEGMLPEAEVAFLDEVFLGSTAILNTLLGILNERSFRRGHTIMRCPLRVCVGASNALPDDPSLAAFADRFLAQVFLQPIEDPLLEELLVAGWAVEAANEPLEGRLAQLEVLTVAARGVNLSPVRPRLAEAVRVLRGAGIELSDRRIVRLQRFVAAAAVLDGRTTASPADLWPIVFGVPRSGDQAKARDVLGPLLAEARNHALTEAAEEASRGPLARAQRLERAIDALLAEPVAEGDAGRQHALRLEGVARELDASLAPETMPPSLVDARGRLVAAIERTRQRDGGHSGEAAVRPAS